MRNLEQEIDGLEFDLELVENRIEVTSVDVSHLKEDITRHDKDLARACGIIRDMSTVLEAAYKARQRQCERIDELETQVAILSQSVNFLLEQAGRGAVCPT